MSTVFTQPSRRLLGVTGAILGGALAVGLAAPAMALDRPAEPAETSAAARSGSTTFTPDLQTEIHIGDGVRPSDFVASPDGLWGYVTADELNEFIVVDMQQRAIAKRIPFEGFGSQYVRVTADGTLAYFVISDRYNTTGIGVIDLATGTLREVFDGVPSNIQEITISRDGASLYALDLAGTVLRLDARTGEELASVTLAGSNYHGLLLRNGDTELLVSHDDVIATLDAATLAETSRAVLPGVRSVGTLAIDRSDERVYFADTSASSLGLFTPASGEIAAKVSVGIIMHEVVGDDDTNRAFGNVPRWDAIMAADFNSGVRSESLRDTPTAPFSLSKNPVTGELLSANGGWSNAEKGSTVTIVNTPSVTDPADVTVTENDESVRFETNAVGIKRGHGGGIAWQSSADGETWADIEGANDEQLDVVATAEARELQYRVRWADDFWGREGASAPASIVAPAPAITFEGPLSEGTVGEAYPSTVITATGQDDLAWSVADTDANTDAVATGLPRGLALDAATGTLSGTPEAAGTFEFTVQVTDMFGEDSRAYELTVVEGDDPTDPTKPTDPPKPGDPAGPGDPANPGDLTNPAGSGGGKGSQLSATGGLSPLLLSLLATGVLAAGGSALLIARKRRDGAA